MQNKKAFNKRRLKYGSIATLITVGFLVALVLVNVIANLLLERFPLNIDLTADNRFALTEDSIDYIKTLNQEVTLTVLADENTYRDRGNQGDVDADRFKQSYEVMKNYTKYSDKVKLEFVDPVKDPNVVKEYTKDSVSTGDVLVRSDLRVKHVSLSSILPQAEQNQYTGSVTYRSEAEQNLTSAIMYVTDQDPVTASLITGLNTPDVSAYVNVLKANNYDVVEQDLMTEEINENAKLLILPQSSADLSADQVKKLEAFLDNEGKFGKGMVFVASKTSPVGPVLKSFLADWGVEIGDGFVLETNNSYVAEGNYYIPQNLVAHETIKTVMGTDAAAPIVAPYMRPVKALFEASDNRTVKTVVATSDGAVFIPADVTDDFDIEAQPKQSYPMVTLTSRLKYDDATPLTSYMATVASPDMLSAYCMTFSQYGNGSMMAAVTETLAAKKNLVTILPIDITLDRINISLSQVITYLVVLVIVIPLATLIVGVVIWLRRRHL